MTAQSITDGSHETLDGANSATVGYHKRDIDEHTRGLSL